MSATVVVGAGKTGVAVACHLALRGQRVVLSDKRPANELVAARETLAIKLGAAAHLVAWEMGGHQEKTFTGAHRIVLSPGVPKLAAVEAAARSGIPVTSGLRLAATQLDAPLVGITGTNGKSTVTALCGAIAEATGRPAFTGGNLGTPLIDAVGSEAAGPDGLCVVEMSSYQLEQVARMRPRAAAFLNLTPDHLDRYEDLAAYGAAKMNIARGMGAGDVLVMNGDDAEVRRCYTAWKQRRGPEVYWLHRAPTNASRVAFYDEHDYVLRLDGGEERYPLPLSRLIGKHNQSNVLAALLLMRASNLASPEHARVGLSSFQALPHRMQLVHEAGGVRYYDDSKATNVDSVVAGLDGFPLPFSLIVGGRDKGGSYAPLVDALKRSTCRGVVAIGEAAPLIVKALEGSGIACERGGDMQDAVKRARARVGSGEAVVLSPACSSFDMFQNYEHRGRMFREAAEATR